MIASLFLVAIMISSASAQSVFAQTPSKITSAATPDNGVSIPTPAQIAAAKAKIHTTAVPANIDNGKWNEYSFTTVGIDSNGCSPDDGSGLACTAGLNSNNLGPKPWTFSLPLHSTGTLKVTDAFLHGDNFEIFDNALSQGTTPAVTQSVVSCGNDPDACFVDPLASHTTVALATGAHSVTIKPLVVNKFNSLGGAAFLKVDITCDKGYEKQTGEGTICVLIHIEQVVGGMGIPIDTTALLLAGMQGSALWMIPAIVVTGAGVAIFKIKSKKKETTS